MHIGQCWSLVHQVIQPHLLKRFLEHIANDMAGGREQLVLQLGSWESHCITASHCVEASKHPIISTLHLWGKFALQCWGNVSWNQARAVTWGQGALQAMRLCDQKKQHADAPHAPRFVTQILNSGLDPQMCARASVNSAQACLVHNGAGFLASWSWENLGSYLTCHFCRWLATMAAEPMLLGSYFRPYYIHKLMHIFFTDCIRLH